MRKIPSLFVRDRDGDRQVRDELVPGTEWVANGEGVATVKWDGTACLVRAGRLFKRYDLKPGRTAPADFEPAGEPDPVTGRVQGWVPVGDGPEDRWHRAGFEPGLEDGTYELLGPRVQGNPYGLPCHVLERHGSTTLPGGPRTFAGLRLYLAVAAIEGIVWHHPDGRMAKIKTRDFGLAWPPTEEWPMSSQILQAYGERIAILEAEVAALREALIKKYTTSDGTVHARGCCACRHHAAQGYPLLHAADCALYVAPQAE